MDKIKLEELVKEQLSIREIGKKMGYSFSNVRYWIKKYGIERDVKKGPKIGSKINNHGEIESKECKNCGISISVYGILQHESKCKLTKEDVNSILDDYLINYLTMEDISEKYFISIGHIMKILKGKTRNNSESNKISKKIRRHSEETKKKISQIRKNYLKNNPDSIKWVGNRSIPSDKFKEILRNNDISFVEEFMPLNDRFFCIDISFPDVKIGIEINGNQHYNSDKTLKPYYQERHELIENSGWKLYEIHHSLVYKSEFIEKIISELKNGYKLGNIDYTFFKSIKRERKKYYCGCGKEKSAKSKICKSCTHLSYRKNERPSYEDLIYQVKEFGYSSTGRKYDVSGNSIKKWIKSYENEKGLQFGVL